MTSIGKDAFGSCHRLISVTIPNSVTSIGESAFCGCSSLISINIPNSVTSIEVITFYGCSSLTSITIGNSVTSIGEGAFYGCSKLISVTIGSSIKNIDVSAFGTCKKLTDVYCYAVNVPNIHSDAFYTGYITLHVPAESIDAYNTAYPWDFFKEIVALTDSDPKPYATGINVIRNSEDNKAVIYDLNGVRQSEPQKGINIIKGKKYVKK